MALTAKQREAVLWANPWCVYCGAAAEQVDHVVPLAQGGGDDPENLTGACRRCNEEKLDFTPAEWRQWRESKGLCWPPESAPAHALRLLREHCGEGELAAVVARFCRELTGRGSGELRSGQRPTTRSTR